MTRNRLEEAKAYYRVGLERVASTAEPEGQKFPLWVKGKNRKEPWLGDEALYWGRAVGNGSVHPRPCLL